jgi:hypothetical protein
MESNTRRQLCHAAVMEETAAQEFGMELIRVSDHGRRVRGGTAGHKVHEQIDRAVRDGKEVRLDFDGVDSVGATFLDEVLGTLVARHDRIVLRSLVFASCNTSVKASIMTALKSLRLVNGLPRFA